MNKTVRILSISVAAAAATFLSGCSSVDMGPATVVDHSTYGDGAASTTASVQTPSLLPGGIVDSGRTHTVAVGDTIYNISVRYGLSAEQLQQLNAITDPTQLRLGQVLRLPASVSAPRAYTGNPQVRVNRVTNDTVLETAPIRNAESVPVVGETSASSSDASAASAEDARKKAEAAAEKARTQAEAAKSQAQQKLNSVTPGQRMIWPVRGKIKSDFAKNTFGLEIAGTQGDVVVAAMQGEVIWVGTLKGYSGTLAVVKHSPTLITAYGGLENVTVSQGSKIKSGQKIADLKGDTLRFEVRETGKCVDPLKYLNKR